MKIAIAMFFLLTTACSAPEPPSAPPPALPPLPAEVENTSEPPHAIYSPEEQRQAWEVMRCGGPCPETERKQ